MESGRTGGRVTEVLHFMCCVFSFSYVPVLMAQAKIYWDMENYGQVEKVCLAVLACGGGGGGGRGVEGPTAGVQC